MKKTLIILFIFILSSILLADEFKIDNKKEIKAGKLKEQGYEIVIQKNTFDTEETLIVEDKVIDIENLTPTISLNLLLKGKEDKFISFQNPIKVKVKITDTSNFQDYLCTFTDTKNNTFYFIPNYINLKDKYIEFYIPHFGLWSCGKGAKDTVINTWALKWYVYLFNNCNIKQSIMDQTRSSFEEMLKSIEIVDSDAIDRFIDDFYYVLQQNTANTTISFAKSGLKKSNEKEMLRYYNDIIYYQMYRVIAKNIHIKGISNLFFGKLKEACSYAINEYDSDSIDLIKSALSNNAQKESFRTALRDSARNEYIKYNNILYRIALEEGFLLWCGKGPYFEGCENCKYNIDEIMKVLNLENIKGTYLSDYCQLLCIKPEDITESAKLRLNNQFKRDLKEYFTNREILENKFEENKDIYTEFISNLYKTNLLSTYGNDKCFDDKKDYYPQTRIEKIFNIYSYLCLIMGNIPMDNVYDKDMVSHIVAFVQSNTGDNTDTFYNYLIEKGLATKATGFKGVNNNNSNNSNNNDNNRTSTGSVLGDILVDIFTGGYGAKQNNCYNLVDIRERRGYGFSGHEGYWKYKDNDHKINYSVSMPRNVVPGKGYDIGLCIERDKAPTHWNNHNFYIKLSSSDVRFARPKLTALGFEETRDTVYLNISSYNPSNGHRIYITVTCHANGSETEATYVYEYKK